MDSYNNKLVGFNKYYEQPSNTDTVSDEKIKALINAVSRTLIEPKNSSTNTSTSKLAATHTVATPTHTSTHTPTHTPTHTVATPTPAAPSQNPVVYQQMIEEKQTSQDDESDNLSSNSSDEESLYVSKDINNIVVSNIMKTENIKQTEENTEPVEPSDIFNFEDLIVNLKFLASVGKGLKLSSSSGKLDADKMYLGSISRWLYSEGRESTFKIIQKIIKSANYHSEYLIKKLHDPNITRQDNEDYTKRINNLTSDLATSQIGIRNLIITYQHDDLFLAKLDVCLDEILTRKTKNMNYNNKMDH